MISSSLNSKKQSPHPLPKSRVKLLCQSGTIWVALMVIGCAARTPQQSYTPQSGKVVAQAVVSLGKSEVTIASVDHGIDFRFIQYSRNISIECAWRRDTGEMVLLGKLDDNGEWFAGNKIAAFGSLDGVWLFLFRKFDPPVEGRLVFREDLGDSGGWYTIPKSKLPVGQSLKYGYALLGAVNVVEGRVADRTLLEKDFGLDPRQPPLLKHPAIMLNSIDMELVAARVYSLPTR